MTVSASWHFSWICERYFEQNVVKLFYFTADFSLSTKYNEQVLNVHVLWQWFVDLQAPSETTRWVQGTFDVTWKREKLVRTHK